MSQNGRGAIDSILTNEKYCGDVLLQKTYIDDCINKKVKKNTGQLPMYLVQNHHEGIISRETFDAAQAELLLVVVRERVRQRKTLRLVGAGTAQICAVGWVILR